MFKVFVADKLAPEGIEALQQYPELEVTFEPGLSPNEAKKFVEDAFCQCEKKYFIDPRHYRFC